MGWIVYWAGLDGVWGRPAGVPFCTIQGAGADI